MESKMRWAIIDAPVNVISKIHLMSQQEIRKTKPGGWIFKISPDISHKIIICLKDSREFAGILNLFAKLVNADESPRIDEIVERLPPRIKPAGRRDGGLEILGTCAMPPHIRALQGRSFC
jgi:hypothetical protein